MCIRDRLDLSIRENGFNRLWKACQAVYACDQDIFYATVFQSVQNGKPEPVSYTHLDVYKRQDYGIMEKAENIYILPGTFGWDDVGSWLAVERIKKTNAVSYTHLDVYKRQRENIKLDLQCWRLREFQMNGCVKQI